MVPWLADLEDALWRRLPATDPAFPWDGTTYVCERQLQEMTPSNVYFVEIWRDRRTLKAVHTWRTPLDVGAWAGLTPPLQQAVLAMLVDGIARVRPVKAPRVEPEYFTPSHYGARSRRGAS